jgi:hypothetical protein
MHYEDTVAAAENADATSAQKDALSSWYIPFLAWTLGAVIFFRQQIGSGFDSISGNIGDARLIVYINEHWFRVFSGLADFRSPSQFYPLQGTLGYSDAFFLYQIFYSPLRLFGVDEFLAFQLTLIGLTAIGFASFFALLRRVFNLPLYLAVGGALIFAFSNMNFLKVGHPQHLTIQFIPLLILFGFEAVKAIGAAQRRAVLFSGLMGLGLALVFFTSYYIGWFFVLVSLVFVPVLLVLNRRQAVAMVKARSLLTGACLLAFTASFLIFLTPFLMTYLPIFLEGRQRSFADNMQYAGWISDLINVGSGNAVWGSIIAGLPGYPVERLENSEAFLAPTPLLMIAMIAGAVFVARHGMRHPVQLRFQGRLILALTITSLVLMMLSIQAGGYSLWWLVWKFVPGASAIRVPYRLQIMNGLIVTLTVILILDYWRRVRQIERRIKGTAEMSGIALTTVVAVLALEQINGATTALISRAHELAFLGKVPAAGQCEVFFIADSKPAGRPSYAYQIDAMLISQHVGIPTINGYSGWEPSGWAVRDPVQGSGYLDFANIWLRQNEVTDGVCAFDEATMAWTVHKVPEPNLLALGQPLVFSAGGNADAFISLTGWAGGEPWGRWTDGKAAAVELKAGSVATGGLELFAEVMAYVSERHPSQEVEVLVNGRKIGSWNFSWEKAGISERRLHIPAELIQSSSRTTITFHPLDPVSPKSVGASGDPRHLGLGIRALRLVEAPASERPGTP